MSQGSNGQPVRIKTSVADDLVFRSMHLVEEMSRLYRCQVELFSNDEKLDLDDVLGHDMTVEIDLPAGGQRHVHGFVSEVVLSGRSGGRTAYTAVLRPWLWFLTQRANCRIFQEKTVPDIIKEVFQDHRYADIRDTLTATYRTWEYCVQYRETDFNFVSRLMEQEGIYYYFDHQDGKDILVLSDAYSAHAALPSYAEIPFSPPDVTLVHEERILHLTLAKTVTPGKYGLSAFDFRQPRTNLEVYLENPHPHSLAEYEVFDYPGEYFVKSEGDDYVQWRLEEAQVRYERVKGETNCMGVFAGGLFTLSDYPRDDQNREYLLVATEQHLSLGDHLRSSGEATLEYQCSFEAMDSQKPFRAERRSPKPCVQGPQTAIVTGPSSEEIHTDKYGRVKVQFRWDRVGKADETSSCWVRVAQVWAGGAWGGMTIPRIGQEVIVSFIEGDPDRPIVTGRVYNADNMPPYELPDNKTRSTLKSRSTKGANADNFNEIRFEDLKDSEEMYIHAEKDQNVVVENNQTILVGFDKKDKGDRSESIFNDRSLSVGRDKSEKVGRNKKIEVAADHQEQIGKSMSVMVAKNLTETIGINYAETVGAAMELTVGAALAMSVGAAMSQTVGGTKSESVGSTKSESIGSTLTVEVGKDLIEEVAGNAKLTVGKDMEEAVKGKRRTEVGKDFSINAKTIQLVAADEITFTTGSAKVSMKKNGDITISGKKIQIKGSGDVIVKGSQVKEN